MIFAKGGGHNESNDSPDRKVDSRGDDWDKIRRELEDREIANRVREIIERSPNPYENDRG